MQRTPPLSMNQFFDDCRVNNQMPEIRPELAPAVGLQPTQGVASTTLTEPDEEG